MVNRLVPWIIIFITIHIVIFSFAKSSYAVEDNEELMVSLKINYEESDSFSTIIKTPYNNYLILLEDLKPFKVSDNYLQTAQIIINDKKYINLNKLENTIIKYNDESLALEINFPADKMIIQQFVGTLIPVTDDLVGKQVQGAFLNYDLTISHNDSTKYVSGLQDLNYFSDKGILYNGFFVKRKIPNKSFLKEKGSKKIDSQTTRLESNWTFDNVENMARWRIGDSVTKGAEWSGSSRFIGIQYSTNFSVRPDLITHPLIDFAGRSELPSTLDVYANSNAIYHGESKTGDFNITDLPVSTGSGELVVRAQDITGKLKTFVLPYYITPSLLKPGLTDFSFEVGSQRKDFGLKSNYYKYIVSNADYMKGINEYWTAGIHFESLKDLASLGCSHILQLGNYGVVNFSLATNLNKFIQTQKSVIGYSYQTGGFSFGTSTTLSGKNYQDVYNYPTSTNTSPTFQISAGYNEKNLGGVSLSFIYYTPGNSNNKSDAVQTITTSYDKKITEYGFFRASVGTDLKNKRKNIFAYISFNVNFENNNMSISNFVQKSRAVKQLGVSSPSNKPLGWGYRADIIKGEKTNYDVQITKNSQKIETSVYLYDYGGTKTEQLGLTGGIVAIDGGLHFTKSVYNSLALVKVGKLKNIPVYNNNLKVGYTDAKGSVLIPNVLSYVPSEIKLDPKKLPLDTNFSTTVLRTAPKWKSGVIVDFDVTQVKSVEMIVVDESKKIIPFDEEVIIDGIKDELFVGYEGKLYINNIGELKTLNGKICKEQNCCHFSVNIDENIKDPIIDIGEVVCR